MKVVFSVLYFEFFVNIFVLKREKQKGKRISLSIVRVASKRWIFLWILSYQHKFLFPEVIWELRRILKLVLTEATILLIISG
jgi:hypothetical protein